MTTEEKFLAAVRVVDSLPKDGPFQPSQNLSLKLYAYQQQATKGICQTPKPLLFNPDRHKWHAWKNLGNMAKETAMKKYVEELSKVVETMSYSEAVSDFMDIMYPFYEIVWVDDKDPNTCSQKEDEEEEELNCQTISENSAVPLSEMNCQVDTLLKDALLYDYIQLQHFVESRTNSSQGYEEAVKENAAVADRRVTRLSNKKSRYVNDPLTMSVLELQKSLDSIVDQLNSLEQMAQLYSKQESSGKPKDKGWKFPPFAVVFVLSWPFIAYWLFHVFQRRRNLRSR